MCLLHVSGIIRVYALALHPLPLACFPTSPEINASWGSQAENTGPWAFRDVSAGGEGTGEVV